MTTTLRPLAHLGTGVLLALALTACGSAGNGAVSSSRSLDDLGAALSKDGTDVERYLAGISNATTDTVDDDATADVHCPGGARRTFRASFVATRFTAGQSDADLKGAVGMGAQARLKLAGYRLTSDTDDAMPATLRFENDPSTPDQRRTFRTEVKPAGDTYTWTISGQTACIRN
jgi:hypothetical protein